MTLTPFELLMKDITNNPLTKTFSYSGKLFSGEQERLKGVTPFTWTFNKTTDTTTINLP